MAFRHPSRRNPVPSKADAYGDGGFFFTQPVGRPTGRVEPGSGRPDPNNSVTASVPFGQGGPFDNELVQTNAPYSRTTYGDGGYYFLSPVNTPNYSGVEGVVRQGMRHPQYGVAMPAMKLQTKGIKVKTAGDKDDVVTNAGARASRRGSGQTETKRGEAVASAATITALKDAYILLGRARFWLEFWKNAKGTSSTSKGELVRAETAYRAARNVSDDALNAYHAGLPQDVVNDGAMIGARMGLGTAFDRKGFYDEAFAGVDSKGKRKVSKVAVDAIKRDVFEAYATKTVSYETAMTTAKKYILGNAQYEWKYEVFKNRLGGTKSGFVRDNFGAWWQTPYGDFKTKYDPNDNRRDTYNYSVDDAYSLRKYSFAEGDMPDEPLWPGRHISTIHDGKYAYARNRTWEFSEPPSGFSYSGGLLWYYPSDLSATDMKKFQQADRYWLIRRKLFEDKALLDGASSELERLRADQVKLRATNEASLQSALVILADARAKAVGEQIGVERTELDKQKSARDAKTFREQTQSAAAGVKTEGVKATTKRGEAMAAGAAGDVAGATAKAGETDTFAKSADSKLANVRKLADSVKTANTASDNRAPSEVTAAETAYRDAANYATQALVDATAAAGAPVVAYAMVASTKRAAAEAAAIAGNEAAAATAAGEADTAAKAADSALGVVTAQGEAVAVSKGFSEEARALVTAAFDEAAKAEAQAKADAESATKQVEVARANKVLIDAKVVADAAVKEAQDAQRRAEEERIRLAQGQSTQAAVDEYQRQASAANDRASQATGAVNAAGTAVTETRAAAASARIPAEPEKLDLSSSGRTSLIGKPGKKVKLGGTGMGEGLSTTVKVAIGVGVLAAAGGAYWWFKIRPKGVK